MGWAFVFKKILNSSFSVGLFNAIAFLSITIFYGFFSAAPAWLAASLLASGFSIFLIALLGKLSQKPFDKEDALSIACFLLLAVISFAITLGLKFRSIDDFSYWGVISKYLFVFNRLPTSDNYIHANFLSYVPGMAGFHYLLFRLANQYSQHLGYFAQSLIFIAALLIVFEPKRLLRSILYLCIFEIVFSFSYGSVFARMEVDAYVAAYLFAICWLIYKKEATKEVFLPIVFLSLMKEIGLFFAFLAISLLLVRKKSRKTVVIAVAATLAVLGNKLLWQHYIQAQHFHSFAPQLSLHSASLVFNPFNSYYQPAQWLYLKAILLANFDYLLKLPYLAIYIILFGLAYRLSQDVNSKKNIRNLMAVFTLFAAIYLLMLFALEAIAFDLGHSTIEVLSFHRYFNMLCLPWLCMLIFLTLDSVPEDTFQRRGKALSVISLGLSLLFLIAGRIEREHRFYHPHQLYELKEIINNEIAQATKPLWTLCLVNPPKPEFQLLMPLKYFFMPNPIVATATEKATDCDFVLAWPDPSHAGEVRFLSQLSSPKSH
ncbi:hypothetical protein EAW55_09695 [Legionella jordanis]|uniref:Glycosyltransferase RgtA/B/C/D-like domain-containing protein n=2 Tax=Legionella jordanis TaxID=456 RepID=A0A0W0VCB8_9GAMM|nr:hypothetical protein [Legionella jordanis]KTD17788.1 hypothetical protein Ljor_2094 [Legionella jordanis]RMX02508.1 hypothetical protein EAW55_09695 [Legionella jordanis]RMX21644.1 hypothetical protein EAS68_02495 [Legionella jordanis]VEH11276.1 Uncharacterised protein [Legionella jordanis]